MDNYFKNPVHEVVDTLAATDTPGKRVIYSVDWKIYEYDTNGVPVADDSTSLGAIASVIGNLGDENKLAQYINGSTFAEVLTPYFPTGNTYNIEGMCLWGDRIVITRWSSGTSKADIIVVYPNGNTYKTTATSVHFTKVAVDSRANLWIGTQAHGVYRAAWDDSWGAFETFTLAGGYIPNDRIDGLVACGEKVWLITAYGTTICVTLFDGSTFTDLTTQFETDTGINLGTLAAVVLYRVTQDDNTMMMSLYDSSTTVNLAYYDNEAELFKVKTLPTAFTGYTMSDFCKVGNYVYSLRAAAGGAKGSAAKMYIWKWSDLAEVYDGTAGDDLAYVCHNDQYVIFYDSSQIYRTSITANSPVEETTWEDAVEDLAPITKAGIVEIACDNTQYVIGLYVHTTVDVNNILKNSYGLKWVVSQL